MRTPRIVSVCSFVALCLISLETLWALPDETTSRPLWTTSRIQGSPEPPPPLRQVIRYPRLKFKQPLFIERDPANQRIWLITREASVLSFPDDPNVAAADLFVDLRAEFEKLTPHATATRVGSAFGIALHPRYPEIPVCWITYTLVGDPNQKHVDDGTRLSRFRVTFDADGIPRCDVRSEKVILAWPEGGHNGACVKFGPDGYLYISSGDNDVPNPPDRRRAGQDVTNLMSTIMRIDVNSTEDGPLYRIPDDNPFAHVTDDQTPVDSDLRFSASEALPEIFAYGFRNPWKMNFGPDGQLWVGDVGWELYEMVYNVKPGANYGWSIVEGPHTVLPNAKRGPTPIVPPAVAYSHAEGASVTGGFVYQGQRFPELQGKYVFGDYETRRIWAADIVSDENGGADRLGDLVDLVDPSVRIVAFGEDTSGELLLLHFDEGTIYELQRNDVASQPSEFPQRLSDTGLFDDVQQKVPAAGLVPFRIHAEMWRDGATANEQRWLGIPGDGSIEVLPKSVRMKESSLREQMHFPTDSVLAQNIIVKDKRGIQITLETQVLHFNGKSWNGYTYVWNPAQTDAQLAPSDGQELNLSDYAEFENHRKWHVHSRSECLRCHNSWAGGALAFNVPQLSSYDSNSGQSADSQLTSLQRMGVITGAPLENAEHLESLYPSMSNPHDANVDLAQRARSYLSVNCAHCHQKGAGGTAVIDLRHAATLEETKTVDIVPAQGAFQIANAAIVAPLQPWKSVLLYRMACSGRGRMPHIGSQEVDVAGINLIRNWISSVPAKEKFLHGPKASLGSTSAALELVAQFDQGNITGRQKEELLKQARDAIPEIRNLFIRFQPLEYRLQQNRIPNVAMVLSQKGDANRGSALFANKRIQCVTCHRIGKTGGHIGPALDDVGLRLKRQEILDSILFPSKKIEPRYAAWTALTVSGKSHSGLLVHRNESHITLRSTKNEDLRIAKDDLEELIQQTVSLMPDRLLNDLTDQQIADLLAYLVNQRTPVNK